MLHAERESLKFYIRQKGVVLHAEQIANLILCDTYLLVFRLSNGHVHLKKKGGKNTHTHTYTCTHTKLMDRDRGR